MTGDSRHELSTDCPVNPTQLSAVKVLLTKTSWTDQAKCMYAALPVNSYFCVGIPKQKYALNNENTKIVVIFMNTVTTTQESGYSHI